MEKEKKYFKELRKKVDIYFVIILSMLSSLSIYMLYERQIINQENIYVLMAILNISFIVYIFSIRKNFKSKNINELDKAIYISKIFLITSFFMIIIIKSIKNRDLLLIYNLTKRLIQGSISISFAIIINSVLIALIVLSFILMSIRRYFYKKPNTPKDNYKKVCTLWDIYTGNFNDKDLKNLKIEDSNKIEHDLFGRTPIVDNLYDSITNFKEHSDCFTIGVVGEWGSGKSSIIELTKNRILSEKFKNNFIIIDDFDPWAIKSQDALILAMYNTIMENLGENISYFKRKKIESALINITTNIPYIGKGIGSFFENRIDDYTEYKEIKADLEEKLEKFDKRLIFIIDNLDRMNSENVLFLLTLIGTLFNLPNITYIVAYDKNRIKKIFKSDKIDSKYIEKIISKEILVPKIHNADKQYVFYNCLTKCIKHKYVDKDKDKDNDKDNLIKIIASKFENIRDFIRFLNFIIYDINSTFLDKTDFLIIRTIEFFDYTLYKKIYENKDLVTKKYPSLEDLDDVEKIFYKQVKVSNFVDLLQYLSFELSIFNITNFDDYISFKDLNINVLCNKNYFENYFSKSKYTEEYLKIKEFFNYTNINYEYVKDFFDEDKLYLNKDYIHGLNTFLKEISPIKNDKNILNTKLYIFIYFLEKIVNGLSYEYTNYISSTFNKYKELSEEEYDNLFESYYLEHSDYFDIIKHIFTIISRSEEFYELKNLSKKFEFEQEFKPFFTFYENPTNSNEVKKIIEKANRTINSFKKILPSKMNSQDKIHVLKLTVEKLFDLSSQKIKE